MFCAFPTWFPRFTVETLDIPAAGHLKTLDVDNALSLEDWRASGLGPCAAMHFDRQVLGEYPNSEEVRACVQPLPKIGLARGGCSCWFRCRSGRRLRYRSLQPSLLKVKIGVVG